MSTFSAPDRAEAKPRTRLFTRSFWWVFALGVALRCVALNHPLVDAGLLRQVQTAAATKSLMEQPGIPLSYNVPWAGNLDDHYVLEFPIYNYLVMPVARVTGHLDFSGKFVSLILWMISFALLQGIWRRMLSSQQTFWANLVFAVAPMSVFYGQAFMPEMLVQALAFGFLLLALRYREDPSLTKWSLCAAIGLLALLVKLPEVSHLYLILAFLLFQREGWKAMIRPRYLIAAAATAIALKFWNHYADSINQIGAPQWASSAALRLFLGPLTARLHFRPWAMIALYLGAFVISGPLVLASAYGLWIFLRREGKLVLSLWLMSLGVFYLLWFGNGAAVQSYYNLPAVAPLCALAGIGIAAFLKLKPISSWAHPAAIIVTLILLGSTLPVSAYLFKPDRRILAAAEWTRTHTQPGDVILFRPNHRWDMLNYPWNPVLAYYSQRPTFVWTGETSENFRQLALERARYAVVTLPPPPPSGLFGKLQHFRGADQRKPESVDWLEAKGFTPLAEQDGFKIYKRE